MIGSVLCYLLTNIMKGNFNAPSISPSVPFCRANFRMTLMRTSKVVVRIAVIPLKHSFVFVLVFAVSETIYGNAGRNLPKAGSGLDGKGIMVSHRRLSYDFSDDIVLFSSSTSEFTRY